MQALIFLLGLLWMAPVHADAIPKTLRGHSGAVLAVAVSPDSHRILSAGADGTLLLWDAATGKILKTFSGHEGAVQVVSISPDGRLAASGGADTTVRLWNLSSGEEERILRGHFGAVTSLTFSSNGQRLISGGSDEAVVLWNTSTGEALHTFFDTRGSGSGFAPLEPVRAVGIAPDGDTVVAAQGNSVRLWQTATGTQVWLQSSKSAIATTVFFPDGERIAFAGQDGGIHLVAAATGAPLRTLETHAGGVNAVALSQDGNHLVSGGQDGTLKLWRLESGSALHVFEGHTQAVTSVAFAPDGRFAVSGSRDHSVRQWDLSSYITPKVAAKAPSPETPAPHIPTPQPETHTPPVEAGDTEPPAIVITSHPITRGIVVVPDLPETSVEGRVTDASGIARVTVNNQPAHLDVSGNFSAGVPLRPGQTKVVVMAEDTRGNMAWETFWVEGKATLSTDRITQDTQPEPAPSMEGRYHALIIGINHYRHLPPLQTAIHDAEEVERILRDHYGFATTLLVDAGRDAIMDAFNRIRSQLTADDHFLIYYAGHGQFDKAVNKAYWLPADAKPDSDTKWIIVDNITSNIKRMAAKHVLVVADSCYSGTLTRSTLTRLTTAEEKRRFLDKMRERPSRTLMASGGNEPVADGGGGGHSVFARAFIEALQQPETPVFTAEQLFHDQIKERVAGSAQQVPEYNIIKNSGHEGGDFVFTKK
ncbi:caspase family protein [Nitrospina watsonii]|uniref:caspase family protein n=1 Tax=Nitrospina watsonii TaxID=1323948 RepID=UPI0024926130|nr:caspase family protein [Nitrospina watsonii]